MKPTWWLILPAVLLVLFIINLALGTVRIPVGEISRIIFYGQSTNPVWNDIVWDFRMTKALTCVLAGAALSISGLQMQTLFRNALAGPDVLGITSGASLAVSIAFMGNADILTNPWSLSLAASAGAIGVFFVMLAFSRNLTDNISLLIIGLMIGAGTASIVSVLQYLSRAEDLQTYMIWTFGTLGSLNWDELTALTVVVFAGCSIAFTQLKALNGWFLGENYGRTIGLNVSRSRILIILSACILTGAVTAFCGPLAFVGLAVPHLVKIFLKTHDHRILIPAVLFSGAILMLFCDILTRISPIETILPINAVTALIGAPVVIWMIVKNRIAD